MTTEGAKQGGAVESAVLLNVVLLCILATVPLLAPGVLLRGFGIANTSFAVTGLVRTFSVFAFPLAAVLWGARKWLRLPSARVTVGALAAAYSASALLLFTQQWAVWYGRSGVALMLSCAVLALAYGRAVMVSRDVQAATT